MNRYTHKFYLCAFLVAGVITIACSRSPQEQGHRYLQQGAKLLDKGDYPRALLAFRNASRVMPTSAEPQYHAGLAFLQMNEFNNAALAFQAAMQLDQKHVPARVKLASLMVTSQDLRTAEEGAKLARQVLSSDKDNPDATIAVAMAEIRAGNARNASRQLEAALAKHPSHTGLALNLARSRAAENDNPAAERTLLKAIETAPKAIELILALGDFYLQTKALTKAEQQYRQALSIEPNHVPGLLALASVLASQGNRSELEQLLRKAADGPDKRYRRSLADYFFGKGRREEGIAELQRLFNDDPNDKPTRTALVNAWLTSGKTAEAENLLAKTLSARGDDTDALLQRANLRLITNDNDKAEEDLLRVIRLLPQSGEARFLLARIHHSRGNSSEARQDLSEALRLDPGLLTARLELARLMRDGGNALTALGLLDSALPEQKQTVSFLLERNWTLLALHRAAEVRPVIETILKAGMNSEALMQTAVMQIDSRDYAMAKTTIEQTLLLAPDDARVLSLLSDVYGRLQQTDVGLQRIQDHIATRPHAHGLKAFYGHLLLSAGKYSAARRPLEAAVSAAPQLTVAQLDLAELDSIEGKLDSARQRLQKLLIQDRDGSLNVRLAGIYEREGQHSQAVQHYRAALAINSRNASALNNLAYHLADRERKYDEAIHYAQQAKEVAPEDSAVDDTLGWTYYQKGLYSMAVRHLEAAVAKQKTARRSYHLSVAYLKNGNLARARALFDTAIKMDPTLPEADAARQLFTEATKTSRRVSND